MKFKTSTLITGGVLAVGIAGTIFYYAFIKKYPLDLAAKIMHVYLSKPEGRNLATNSQYGGEFPVDLFRPAINSSCSVADSCGIALWFCIDPNSNDFYLALERDTWNYQYDRLPTFPRSNVLYKPVGRFKIPPGGLITENAIKGYVLGHNRVPNEPLQAIDSAEVIRGIKLFRSRFQNWSRYNFSFIAENNRGDVADCITAAGPAGYLRYYIGFEDSVGGRVMPNKMRVILVSADRNGRNQAHGRKSEDPILQSSWPPPPY